MKIKLIKLIEDELIKILKGKSLYLLIVILLVVIVYNVFTSVQNHNKITIYNKNRNSITQDISIQLIEKELIKLEEDSNEYILQKSYLDFGKLYNTFKEDSWQRYALNEEIDFNYMENVYTDSNLDINELIKNINDYEINSNSKITLEKYQDYKYKYNQYVTALKSNDWKLYINLKIKNLEEKKSLKNFLDKEKELIDFEINTYKLRLKNNINFDYNIANEYLHEYRLNYYMYKHYSYLSENYSESFIKNSRNKNVAKMNILQYALENNIIDQNISNENTLISFDIKDARINFIRIFKHFDIIFIIMVIYVSVISIAYEIDKGTIKNLLIKPHRRSTILVSKIIACSITIIIFIVLIILIQYFVGGFVFGFESYKLEYINYNFNTNEIVVLKLFNYIILLIISKFPMYLMIILFSIFICIISKNQVISMIIILTISLLGNTVFTELSKLEIISAVTRFFITNNWDFSVYLFGQVSAINGVNLRSSLVVYFIYTILLLVISFYYFNKKEINN